MEPKILEPPEIKDVAQFIQSVLESDELNAVGAIKVLKFLLDIEYRMNFSK